MTKRITSTPPRLAELIVRYASSPHDAELVVGDFREAFDDLVSSRGPAAARRWYWLETITSCVPLFVRRRQTASRHRSSSQPTDPMWTPLVGDARYALRLSLRSPLASFAIVATMILGIGSTTAVFSAMNAILLKPLPFPESSRVVKLSAGVPDGRVIDALAFPDLNDFRRTVPDFEAVTVFQPASLTLQNGSNPQLLRGLQVDEMYPRVFGVHVEVGRWFNAADMAVNASKVVMLSHAAWAREFGADRGLVGRTITLDDESVQVIGVLAADAYTYPRMDADMLTPLIIHPNTMMTNRGALWAGASAKLKPSATLEQARRDLLSASNLIATEHSNTNTGISAHLTPVHDAVVGSVQSMLLLLAAAVAAVLLIACINIANLILGRAQTRSREFAVRSALGGSPARVRQQVLTESLVLAVIGGLLGAALAPLLTRTLIAVYPNSLPRAEEIGVDGRVLLVAALATIVAGILSSLPTARRAGRLDLVADLRDGGRSGTGRDDRRMGGVLIVSQVAASLALLFAAGLLLQTFWRLTRVGPGFDSANVTTFHVFASNAHHRDRGAVNRYYNAATEALRAIPGVDEVSSSTMVPFVNDRFNDVFVQEEVGDKGPSNPSAAIGFIAPGFERALGLRVLRGRTFTTSDDSASAPVVMINEALATRNYPGVNPVGHLIEWQGKKHWQIVGVVASTHLDNLWDAPASVLYAPTAQFTRRSRFFLIRSPLPADRVLTAARIALGKVDPSIALTDPMTMNERINASLGAQRFRAALMATLGALALALAVIGIYGVVGYTVTRRTREIGIRMALGEAAHEVRRRVVGDTLRVASIGIVAGVALALFAGKWLTVFLVDVSPYDARLLGGAAVALAAVVSVAAYGPARRAARVDPVTALRAD
jgi:predicted permease